MRRHHADVFSSADGEPEAGSESGPPCDLAAGRVVTLNRARWDRWAMPTGVSKTLKLAIGESAHQAHLVCAASPSPSHPGPQTPRRGISKRFLKSCTRSMCRRYAHNVWIVWRLMISFRGRVRPGESGQIREATGNPLSCNNGLCWRQAPLQDLRRRDILRAFERLFGYHSGPLLCRTDKPLPSSGSETGGYLTRLNS